LKADVKAKIISISVILTLLIIILGTMLAPDQAFSAAERRRLTTQPDFSLASVLKGDYFTDLEQYLLDQIVWRDFFRSVKAVTVYQVLRQTDNNGLYFIDGHIGKIEALLRPASVASAAVKFNELRQRYFPDQPVWLAVIPDKNHYLGRTRGFPAVNLAEMMAILARDLNAISLIDLTACFSAADYYRTDIHWRQENLLPLADLLLMEMGNPVRSSDQTYTQDAYSPFRGSLYGQAALPVSPDELVCLTNEMIGQTRVYDHEQNTWGVVYNPELFTGMDPYDVYLGGAKPLLTLVNEMADTERELIIFRDSFASSLAPLLLPGYSRIILVDLRYMRSELLAEHITFGPEQDILFLYSTPVLGNSAMLR
jgi:hypothetical protein